MQGVQTPRHSAKRAGANAAIVPGWFLGFGVFYIIMGILAVLVPWVVTLVSVAFFGILLFVTGVAGLVHGFQSKNWGSDSFAVELLAGALAIVTGSLMFFNTDVSAVMLTLLLGAYFLTSGLFRGCFALLHPDVPYRFSLMANGLINLLVGGLILAQWPGSGLWVLGTFIGIDFVVYGAALLHFHSVLKKATRD